ncbi:helix-turn-helix transcriptional regulator [Kitasatospora acidiphila]|uniref:Helix-turn-helix transcriptional regulator n=1 Tax=Kitasatospora acidiphila TaxID=2567942 RepID=A0A540W5D2_9ACTN|nr:helix-turn-helix transcriptional regulator [Kitasatospora acidiphila]TQF04212.1 helix-turn-helix transcriptional regulator [Kitasatospora acidiphila]
MLSASILAARPEFTVAVVGCRSDHVRWSGLETRDDHRLVLVRRGRFRRWVDGGEADLDPTMAYLGAPGEEERFAHPAGGDLCTSVSFTPALLGHPPTAATVYVDARVDLAHRRLVVAAGTGDVDYALTEELVRLVAAAAGEPSVQSQPRPRPHSRPADRALAAAAREAITEEAAEAAGLSGLAALLEVSPYRLSRVFSRETGVSLTRYRNRVRVTRAMDRIAEGAPSLADLAAQLGFADQAHLTRTIREHVGHTPTALRRLLAPGPGATGLPQVARPPVLAGADPGWLR